MESSGISLCLFFLVNHLSLYFTTGDHLNESDLIPTIPTDPFDIPNNVTGADCLIDTQMGLIAVASAGGLIVCLLVSTLILACQVCYLQRRVSPLRPSRSNMDLVSHTGYWGTERPEVGGLVGPCDASVMLEEVRADTEMADEKGEAVMQEREEKVGTGLEEGAKAIAFDAEEMADQMQRSSSKDSCLDVPRNLEDMPLVV